MGGALSYIVQWENWYAVGNFGQEWLWGSFAVTRSDSESIFQQQYGEYHGYGGCYSIYFDRNTIVRLSGFLWKVSNEQYLGLLVYYSAKTRRHRQNGLSYVPKKIFTWMLREDKGALKATVGNRVNPDYHFTRIVFCCFFFCFFQPDSCVPWQAMLKSMSTHIRHCGPKPGWGLKNIFKFV